MVLESPKIDEPYKSNSGASMVVVDLDQMAGDWMKKLGKVHSFVGKTMGGLSGRSNLASWAVAGTLAYYLWVKPSQDLRKEQQEKAALAALSNSYQHAEAQKSIVQLLGSP